MRTKKISYMMRALAVVGLIILVLSPLSNCKKSITPSDMIAIAMTQTRWGLNYASSMGNVEVFLQGGDVGRIVLDSIEMTGDNPSTPPLKAEIAVFDGGRVRAEFAKNRVLALLTNPANGSTHTVSISFFMEDSYDRVEVSTDVTVSSYIDEGDSTDFTLEIDPEEWNLNFTNSAGTVEAFIRGEGIDQVDLSSIEMIGDNPSASPLAAISASINNDHIHARFAKSQVIDLLLSPDEGTTHTVIVSFLEIDGTERIELSAVITIEDEDEIDPTELTLEIDPDVWSLNFPNSRGTVEAFIYGEGIDQIDLNSIEMEGDDPSASPLAATSATINGDHIHARFPKNQVIGLLLDPTEGSTHTITISFLEIGGSERIELTAVITIEDDDEIDPSELTLEIDPDVWSLNFPNSRGTVEAFIRGEGIDQIDLNSIEMEGDDPSASPLAANSAALNGDHIHARFPKNQVIGLLLNPTEGSTHTITISFLEIGGSERIELTAEITIEDDGDDNGIDPSDLSLQLSPSTWNMNYYGSAGTVQAKIRGEGIENIDLDSIEMEGDNSSAAPLSATSASLQGNHVSADFPKSQVLDLLLNPAKGTTHTVTVTFKEKQGSQRFELTAEVNIE